MILGPSHMEANQEQAKVKVRSRTRATDSFSLPDRKQLLLKPLVPRGGQILGLCALLCPCPATSISAFQVVAWVTPPPGSLP